MRMCQDHWLSLKAAIEERGMGGLVTSDGIEAARRVEALINGSTDPNDFDPLFFASVAIMSYFKANGGNVSDTICPICHAANNSSEGDLASNWINGCADDMLAVAISKGLVTRQ